jgi:hypothetical protein
MPFTFAHETWFVDKTTLDWGFLAEGLTLALLAVAVLATLAVRVLSRTWPGADVPFLARMAPWMPFAIRIHVAVSLVGLLSMGVFLAPSMDLPGTVAGVALGIGMALVAIGMATGWHTREAAILLVALGPLGALVFGAGDVLQRVDFLGMAVFVLLAGPGRWSADVELGRRADATIADLARAVWALRLAVGLTLIVVALAEKLANPQMALDFLAEHPHFNIAQSLLGIGMSDLEFVRAAGVIEVAFGLLLISGALPQLCVLAAGIPFNATLYFFGTVELMGHLPVYGAMLVLLVFGSHPQLRPAVSALWPWEARRTARGARTADVVAVNA